MVENYVPLIDQLGEIVKKNDKIVDGLQQIVTSLRLENAELKNGFHGMNRRTWLIR